VVLLVLGSGTINVENLLAQISGYFTVKVIYGNNNPETSPTAACELVLRRNVFEDILAGKLPASFVYRDEQVAAIMDIQPVNPGHVLVIPTEPKQFLHQLNAEIAARMFEVARCIAQAIRASDTDCEGVNLFLADGAAAGQEVPHVHLHVIPRFKNDGFGLKFGPKYFEKTPREELEKAAEIIRTALERAV
jgi:histidine triad (HIT) family protein